jgi:hypothetical protein
MRGNGSARGGKNARQENRDRPEIIQDIISFDFIFIVAASVIVIRRLRNLQGGNCGQIENQPRDAGS